jgi:hypothetical protein
MLILFVVLAIAAVFIGYTTHKKTQLQDFQKTMASGSRDPRAMYGSLRKDRIISFLLILVGVSFMYSLLPRFERRTPPPLKEVQETLKVTTPDTTTTKIRNWNIQQ